MARGNQKPHAIVIPCPFQGHINPSIYLSLKLATKGFAVTFINTEYTHAQITKSQQLDQNSTIHDIFEKFQESGLDIHYQTVSDGFPLEFDRFSGSNQDDFLEGFLLNYPVHVDEVVGKLVELENPKPTCLVVDTFLAWGTKISNKYELVSVSFFTQSALMFTIDYHLDLLLKNGHFGSNDDRKDTIDYIPGISAIEPSDLPSYFKTKETSTILHQTIYKGLEDAKKSDIIICNTVQELESKVISTLQEKIKKTFYAIGPILSTSVTFSKSLWPESNCVEWLNTKPKSSVLYFSLGSLFSLSKEDVMEFAQGLMLSKVSFIWVLRPNLAVTDETNFLPVGFQENVDRGLVVPWCNQRVVLSHPAIGGFLTHCGWNSILESLWASVPMICHPIAVDQTTNRKLVVDEWKVGINLCDNYNKSITKEEVAKTINFLMSEENSKGLREAVKEVTKTMKIALLANGSSEKFFDLFVEDVMAKTKIAIL
ncbi:UDP-glycosyltransferase 86A1-like [Lycium barbarum]|uniref:UDP-glycosyltransferase 86A1-like n=1 Tax=Lycium barbarum TaxID=112863 RepID=UPI00293E99FA|nr:UDP-glycosyltransferase 86A1-like [Lycium barbarum]